MWLFALEMTGFEQRKAKKGNKMRKKGGRKKVRKEGEKSTDYVLH